jgi:hypothetical protein
MRAVETSLCLSVVFNTDPRTLIVSATEKAFGVELRTDVYLIWHLGFSGSD